MRSTPKPLPPTSPQGRWRKGLFFALLVLVALGAYASFDPADGGLFPSCILQRVTGYRCPGCGSQRALHALLHGQWAEAFRYNYFLLVVLPLSLLLGYGVACPERTPRLRRALRHPLFLTLLGLLVIGWWILRNSLDL